MKIFVSSMICILLFGGWNGCDEHLPPRDDPSELLHGSTVADYVITTQHNLVRLRFTVVNTYDEVIEGTSSIEGTLALSLIRDPSVTRTFKLTSTNLQFAREFNSSTQFLKILPGDSVVFTADFNFIDDSGRVLREYFPFVNDPACPGRLVSFRETFLLRAEVDLFPRVATIVAAPLLYDVCYVTVYVEPNVCVPITSSTSACLN